MAAGAVTALAAFVIVPGSIAMLVRLERADLPSDLGVVTSLPQQFLIALGLGFVVAPLLIPVTLGLAVVWLPGDAGGLRRPVDALQGALLLVFLIACAAIPFAVWSSPSFWTFPLAVATGLAFLGIAAVVGSRPPSRQVAFGLLLTAAALLFVPWAVLFAGFRNEFQPATACLKNKGEVSGVFIGRTSEELFIGEPEHRATLVAIPDRVTQSKIVGGLKAAGIGAHPISDASLVTFQRTSIVIADVSGGIDHIRDAIEARVPVLGYYSDSPPPDESGVERELEEAGGRVVRQQVLVRPDDLREVIESVLTESRGAFPRRLRPPRRIAAIAASELDGYRLGAAGPCPIRS